jgi:hypothetical protein
MNPTDRGHHISAVRHTHGKDEIASTNYAREERHTISSLCLLLTGTLYSIYFPAQLGYKSATGRYPESLAIPAFLLALGPVLGSVGGSRLFARKGAIKGAAIAGGLEILSFSACYLFN